MAERMVLKIEKGAADTGPIPEGTYTAVIDDVTLVESKSAKNSGKPMYKVRLKFTGPSSVGRVLVTSVCLWPEALFSYYQLVRGIGKPVAKDADEVSVLTEAELIGKSVGVVVEHREYNGEMSASVKRFDLPAGGAGDVEVSGSATKRKGRVAL